SLRAVLGNLIGQRIEIELNVGGALTRVASEKAARLIDAEGQWPLAGQQILHPGPRFPDPAAEVVVESSPVGAVEVTCAGVVLKVLADGRQMVSHGDPVLAQQRLVPDTGELQQLRSVYRSGRQDDLPRSAALLLLPLLPVGDSRRSPAFVEENAL